MNPKVKTRKRNEYKRDHKTLDMQNDGKVKSFIKKRIQKINSLNSKFVVINSTDTNSSLQFV